MQTFSVSYANLKRTSHAVGQNTYHIEFCLKYRYRMFRKPKYKKMLHGLLHEAAARHGIVIKTVAIAADHVHIIAELPFHMSPSKAVQLLKGYTSYMLFRANPNFRKRYPKGNFWSRGKFIRSIGDVDVETVTSYVRAHGQMTLESYQCQKTAGSPAL